MGVGKEAPGMLLRFGAEALEQLQGRQLFMKAAANFRGKVTTDEKREHDVFKSCRGVRRITPRSSYKQGADGYKRA